MKRRHALFVLVPTLALLLAGCGPAVRWCFDGGCIQL